MTKLANFVIVIRNLDTPSRRSGSAVSFEPVGELFAGGFGELAGSVGVEVPGVLVVGVGEFGDVFGEDVEVWVLGSFPLDECGVGGGALGIWEVAPEHFGEWKGEPEDLDIVLCCEGAKFIEVHFVIRVDDDGGAEERGDVVFADDGAGGLYGGAFVYGNFCAGVLHGADGGFEVFEKEGVADGDEFIQFFAVAEGVAEAAEGAVEPVAGFYAVAEEAGAFLRRGEAGHEAIEKRIAPGEWMGGEDDELRGFFFGDLAAEDEVVEKGGCAGKGVVADLVVWAEVGLDEGDADAAGGAVAHELDVGGREVADFFGAVLDGARHEPFGHDSEQRLNAEDADDEEPEGCERGLFRMRSR